MKVQEQDLEGIVLIEPDVFGDNRGFFCELWNEERAAAENINLRFRQDNLSRSQKGVLRGLHFQQPFAQGKFITVLEGQVYDVAVDLRPDSKTYKQWRSYTLTGENKRQLYVPEGFAHGFLVESESALFLYKCTEVYHPECEHSLKWDDEEIGVEWPLEGQEPQLSKKDSDGKSFQYIEEHILKTN